MDDLAKLRWEIGIRTAVEKFEHELRTRPYQLTDETAIQRAIDRGKHVHQWLGAGRIICRVGECQL